MRQGRLGKHHTEEARRKLSEAQRRRGLWPLAAGRPWTAEEEALLGTMADAEVAVRTNRTLQAVYDRRRKLGIPRWRGLKL
jgi:hypothetical protein